MSVVKLVASSFIGAIGHRYLNPVFEQLEEDVPATWPLFARYSSGIVMLYFCMRLFIPRHMRAVVTGSFFSGAVGVGVGVGGGYLWDHARDGK